MAAAWLAICYIRAGQDGPFNSSARPTESATAPISIRPQLQAPVKLVYAAPEDKTYYHNPNHLPAVSERSALSEDAARRLGLRPCPICIRQHTAR